MAIVFANDTFSTTLLPFYIFPFITHMRWRERINGSQPILRTLQVETSHSAWGRNGYLEHLLLNEADRIIL